MTGDLPPLPRSPAFPQRDKADAMAQSTPLPSFKELTSPGFVYPSATHTSGPRPRVSWPPSNRHSSPAPEDRCGVSSVASPAPGSAWTPINRPNSEASLAPILGNTDRIHQTAHDRSEHGTPPASASSTTDAGTKAHSGRLSPPRCGQSEPPREQHPLGKRQDSAISESDHYTNPNGQGWSSASNTPSFPLVNNSGILHSPAKAHMTIAFSATARSPQHPAPAIHSRPPPTRAHSTGHGRRRHPPSLTSPESRHSRTSSSGYAPPRERAYSDSRSRVSPSNAEITSPRRVRFEEHAGSQSMPPPLSAPQQSATVHFPAPETSSQGVAPEPRGSPAEQDTVAGYESSGRNTASVVNHNTPHLTANAGTSPHSSQQKCLFCGDVWTYPLPGISVPNRQSATLRESEQGWHQMMRSLARHGEMKVSSYKAWLARHRIEQVDMDIVPPCCAAQPDTPEESTSLAGKRKLEIPMEEAEMTSKFRRMTYDSPSPKAQLSTPPSDMPSATSAPPSSNVPGKYQYESANGTTVINEQMATILKMVTEERRPRYISPPNDDTNMWHEPDHKGREKPQGEHNGDQKTSESPQPEVKVEAEDTEESRHPDGGGGEERASPVMS